MYRNIITAARTRVVKDLKHFMDKGDIGDNLFNAIKYSASIVLYDDAVTIEKLVDEQIENALELEHWQNKLIEKGWTPPVDNYEYPIYKIGIGSEVVVKFKSLKSGTIIVASKNSSQVGYESDDCAPHNDSSFWEDWNPHKELKELYAEDVSQLFNPWKMWESRDDGGEWIELTGHPRWNVERKYRRKQKVTICGLTKSQWDAVKNKEWVCTFWDTREELGITQQLYNVSFDTDQPFSTDMNTSWSHCRVHYSQPQFVINNKKPDWLNDDDLIIINGSRTVVMVKNVRFDNPNCKVKMFQLVGM